MEDGKSGPIVQALKCPVCGANVKLYARECEYCGSTLVIVSVDSAQGRKTDSQAFVASLAKWKDILSQNPSDAEANYAVGIAVLQQGLRDAALPYLRRAAQLAPKVSQSSLMF